VKYNDVESLLICMETIEKKNVKTARMAVAWDKHNGDGTPGVTRASILFLTKKGKKIIDGNHGRII